MSADRPALIFATTGRNAEAASAYLDLQIPDVPQVLFLRGGGLHAIPWRPALIVVTWTGEHGGWLYKTLPFLLPPFRVLVMNENGGFFPGRPGPVLRHMSRRATDALHSGANRARDLGRGMALWLFAVVAARFAFLSRRAFRKGHGSEPLDIAVRPATGETDEIVCFEHPPRQWDRRALIRLLETSRARWVLVTESRPPGTAGAADLPRWVEDPRTFAVACQRDFQDWKPGLFSTAPFRQLQPEEISQTLAPVSDRILVDRRKLLALGIPDTVVTGAAWLLLFWRAAAAGWRSYSVGGNKILEEAADWPYEEAEFVTRVLREPQLRRLGPVEPDLARGNIAHWADPPAWRSGARTTVLVVSPYLPYPLSHGGAVRIFNLSRALGDRVDFLLIAFREKGEKVHYARLHDVFREVRVVDRDEKASADPDLPRQVREHQSRSMRAAIADICRERRVDLLQIEFTHMAHFRDAAPAPAILVEHDLTFTLYRQFADQDSKRAARQEFERWLAYERRWFGGFDAVWTMSDQDREQALEQGSPEGLTFTVANGVDTERFRPGSVPAPAPEVFYMGSFRHKPNVIGFERLLREIMPRVWKKIPGARLRVVAGPSPEKYWKGRADRRVRFHGFVEDPRPMYAKAAVVAVPLLVSAGTNIKVMEAMACGKAVVSTPVGCQGLGLEDGRDALIRADSRAFADAIIKLIGDDRLREAVAARARRTVEERFDWKQIAGQAWDSYREVLARAKGASGDV